MSLLPTERRQAALPSRCCSVLGPWTDLRLHASKGRASTCARTTDAYTPSMGRDSRVYVKASPEEQEVFRAVAAALGQADNMSAAIRCVMFEKARELSISKAARRTRKAGTS